MSFTVTLTNQGAPLQLPRHCESCLSDWGCSCDLRGIKAQWLYLKVSHACMAEVLEQVSSLWRQTEGKKLSKQKEKNSAPLMSLKSDDEGMISGKFMEWREFLSKNVRNCHLVEYLWSCSCTEVCVTDRTAVCVHWAQVLS